MTDKTKTNNSAWIVIVIIAIAVAIGATIINLKKNESTSEIADKSNNTKVNDPKNSAATQNGPFSEWIGKPAPDFTVTDLEGKQHSISSYIGKNLLVNFWATWCPPCRAEIPHLIELRKQESEDDLAILAISNESKEDVKKFVDAEKMNYTVATLGNSYLPKPFIDVEYIPTTFFIDKKGNIKTVKIQSLTLEQIKSVLESE